MPNVDKYEVVEAIIADAKQEFNDGGMYFKLVRVDHIPEDEGLNTRTSLFLEITHSNMGVSTTTRVQVFSSTLPILQQFCFDIQKLVGQIDPVWLNSINATVTFDRDTVPRRVRYSVEDNRITGTSLDHCSDCDTFSDVPHAEDCPVTKRVREAFRNSGESTWGNLE